MGNMKARTKYGVVNILDHHDLPTGFLYLVQYVDGNTSEFWIFEEFLTFEVDNGDTNRVQST